MSFSAAATTGGRDGADGIELVAANGDYVGVTILVLMPVKTELSLVPSAVKAVTAATATSAAINPYSIAVTPASLVMNLFIFAIIT
jgi:hypothetical protein